MKKILIAVVVLVILGYFFIPPLYITFINKALVSYVEKFDNSPELKEELISIINRVTDGIHEQGAEEYLQGFNREDSMFLVRSMDKIKDNAQGLLEKPLSDSDLRKMIARANRILNTGGGEYYGTTGGNPEMGETTEEPVSLVEDKPEETMDPDLEALLRKRAEEDKAAREEDAKLEEERRKRMQQAVENFGSSAKDIDWHKD